MPTFGRRFLFFARGWRRENGMSKQARRTPWGGSTDEVEGVVPRRHEKHSCVRNGVQHRRQPLRPPRPRPGRNEAKRCVAAPSNPAGSRPNESRSHARIVAGVGLRTPSRVQVERLGAFSVHAASRAWHDLIDSCVCCHHRHHRSSQDRLLGGRIHGVLAPTEN